MKKNSDLKNLTLLGIQKNKATKKLECFPNKNEERNYLVELTTEEFTCLCPATGQPDYAKITISYVPAKKIVESKSLKMYLWSYRNEGCFHEHLTNKILDDIVAAAKPKYCKIIGEFNARGGISITVTAEHGKF